MAAMAGTKHARMPPPIEKNRLIKKVCHIVRFPGTTSITDAPTHLLSSCLVCISKVRKSVHQWEYLEVFDSLNVHALVVNGKELPPGHYMNLHQYLNHLGSQGWEMVGFAMFAGGPSYMFKRPKS
jgi:hypothetical protein